MTSWLKKAKGLSLREKLPLVGSALIGGALLVAGTLAYLEVRRAAHSEAQDRLGSLSSELVSLYQADIEERAELREAITASREVRDALSTARVDTADLTLALDSLREPSDRNLPVALVGAHRSTIFSMGFLPGGPDPDPDPPLVSVPAYGPVRSVGDMNLYWETTPVLGAGDQVLGWIAQRRRLESSGELARLWGEGIRFRLGQLRDSVWVDLRGERWAIDPESIRLREAPFVQRAADGPAVLARARRIDRTPWIVLVDMPLSQVLARPRVFLVRMVILGGLVITAAILLAWWMSSRLTGPLLELADAADAMRGGDYGRRVEADREDELGRLAMTFNRMSERVARSEAELHERLEEARRLAENLAVARRAAEEARTEAEKANQAKADILAAISHEIRTPISAVMAYAEMLTSLDGSEDAERQHRYVERIEECTEMLSALTDDILDFSCIESGQLRIDIGRQRVDDVIRLVVGSLEPRATRNEITISNGCSGGAVFMGDRQRVQQIVMNLVSNAVKFTPAGGKVTVRCQQDVMDPPPGVDGPSGPWVTISVEDTGPGIEPEELERIFEPFQRGGGRNGDGSHVPGVGLGLPISRQLAEMMSGTLTVESRPGEGSRFTVWLPGGGARSRRATPIPRDRIEAPSRHPSPPPTPPATPPPEL